MALGIVPDDIFEQELEKFLAPVIVQPKKLGKPEGPNVPDTIRKVIGDTHLESGSKAAHELAEVFGVGERAAYAYGKGETSPNGGPAKSLAPHIAKTKERIAKKAGKLVISALNAITDEKLAEAKAGELASVARSAASIVKDMEPEPESNKVQSLTQIVLHAPRMVTEEKYEVIEVVSNDDE